MRAIIVLSFLITTNILANLTHIKTGAISAAARELISPLTQGESKTTQLALSQLTGTLVGYALNKDKGATTGYNISTSAEEYNRQLHEKEIEFIKDKKNIKAFVKYYQKATGKSLTKTEAQKILARGGVSLVDKSWNDKVGSSESVFLAKEFIKDNYKDNSILFYSDKDNNIYTTYGFNPNKEEYNNRYANIEGFINHKDFYQQNLQQNSNDSADIRDYLYGVIKPIKEYINAIEDNPKETIKATANAILHPLDSGYEYGKNIHYLEDKAQLDNIVGDKQSAAINRGEAYGGITATIVTRGAFKGVRGVKSIKEKTFKSLDESLNIKINPLDGTEKGNLLNKGPNGGKVSLTKYNTIDNKPIFKRDNGEYFIYDDSGKQVRVNSPKEHGNSASSTNEQHGYYIIDKDTGNRVKVGVSGQPLKSDGSSSRAQSQVDKLNEKRRKEQFTHEVAKKVPSGENARKEILEWEKQEAEKLRKNNEIDPKIHQKP